MNSLFLRTDAFGNEVTMTTTEPVFNTTLKLPEIKVGDILIGRMCNFSSSGDGNYIADNLNVGRRTVHIVLEIHISETSLYYRLKTNVTNKLDIYRWSVVKVIFAEKAS